MGKEYILAFAAGGFTDYLEKSIDWDAVMPQVDFCKPDDLRPGKWL